MNFVSDDRYAIANRKQHRFSTPVSGYGPFGSYRLPSYGEAVWHDPGGAFVYGRFHTQRVQDNVQ